MITLKNLKKSYSSNKKEKFIALNDITLELPNTGFIFVVGKSGSGKSTLLNVLGGLDKYDSGEIIVKGKSTMDFKDADFDSYRNTYVGFVFQEFNLLEEYTIEKNIRLALELQGKTGDNDVIIKDILDKVELYDKKDNKINEISGGQKQRVAIARALVKNPDIILADEPTGNLDSETGKQIMDTLKTLSNDKLVVMITHDIEYANDYADRIIELKDGRVLKDTILKQLDYSSKGEFRLIKSTLPFMDIIKMGARGLFLKGGKSILTFLLLSIALFLFGQATTLQHFNFGTSVVDKAYGQHIELINDKSNHKYKFYTFEAFEEMNNQYNVPMGMYYNKKKVTKEYVGNCVSYSSGKVYKGECATGVIYSTNPSKLIEGTTFELIAGNKTSKGTNEVLITDYLAKSLLEAYGVDQVSDLIGRDVAIGYRISGIFKTNHEEQVSIVQTIIDKYYSENQGYVPTDNMNDYEKETFENWNKYRAFMTAVYIEYIENLHEYEFKNTVRYYNNVQNITMSGWSSYNQSSIAVINDDYDGIVLAGGRTKLADKELVIQKSELKAINIHLGNPDLYYIPTDGFDVNYAGSSGYKVVGYYDATENAYNIDDYYSISYGYASVLVNEQTLNTLDNLFSSKIRVFSVEEETVVLVSLVGDKSILVNLLNNAFSREMFSKDSPTFSIEKFAEKQELARNYIQFTPIGIYGSLLFVALAGLLQLNNITASILQRKKEIGILRALGAKGTSISIIYMIESLIMGILVSVTSLVIVFLASRGFNGFLNKISGADMNLFIISLPVIQKVLVVGIGASILAALIPTIKVSKMQPVDAIRNK